MTIYRIAVYIFLTILICFCSLYGLGNRPLERWDEQTNANVINGTLSPFFVLQTADGKPFFEKPPLWYISTLLITHNFGTTPITLRLISALSSLIVACVIFRMSQQDSSWKGGVVAIGVWLAIGQLWRNNVGGFFSTHTLRSADVDGLFLALVMLSWYVFWYTRISISHRCILGIFISSLAFMTKGPLAFVAPFLFLVTHKKEVSRQTYLWSIIGVLCVILPWYIGMFLQYGQSFFTQHIHYHLFIRATTALEGHNHPWWWYGKLLLNWDVFPFLDMLILSSIINWQYNTVHSRMATIFILSTLLIITTVQTKLAWYLLPIYPFVAYAIGTSISTWSAISSRVKQYAYTQYAVTGVWIVFITRVGYYLAKTMLSVWGGS